MLHSSIDTGSHQLAQGADGDPNTAIGNLSVQLEANLVLLHGRDIGQVVVQAGQRLAKPVTSRVITQPASPALPQCRLPYADT